MDCGIADVEYLVDYLNNAERLGIELEDIVNDAEEIGKLDANALIYVTFDQIFFRTVDYLLDSLGEYIDSEDLEEKVMDYLEEMKDNFSPFINFLDSHFDNLLDQIDWDSVSGIDEAANELLQLVLDEVE